MNFDDSSKMPLYHVQLETRHRIVSYEIATQNFDHAEEAIMHLSLRLVKGEDYIHVGGCSCIGYVAKNDFAQILEAKATTGQPFEESKK